MQVIPPSGSAGVGASRQPCSASPGGWLKLGCWLLLAAGLAGLGHGLWSLLVGQDTDLHKRWAEQYCVLHRINPGDNFTRAELSRSAMPSKEIQAFPTGPAVRVYPCGYPPWSYLTGFLLVPPLPFEAVRIYFMLLNLAALALTLGVVFKLGQTLAPPQRWFLVAAVFAVFAHNYTLRLGQYGILVNALLLALLLPGGRGSQFLAGLALSLAAVKPQMAALFFLIPLVRGRWLTFLTASGLTLAATAVICWWLQAGPIAMLRQVFEQSANYDSGDKGLIRVLRAFGAERSSVTMALLVGGLVTCGGLLWRYRRQSPLVLMAIAAVLGRLWMYHRGYDDVMLIFLLVPLGLVALQRRDRWGGWVFGLVGLSLWAPAWRSEEYTVVAMGKISVWLLGFVYLLGQVESLKRNENRA